MINGLNLYLISHQSKKKIYFGIIFLIFILSVISMSAGYVIDEPESPPADFQASQIPSSADIEAELARFDPKQSSNLGDQEYLGDILKKDILNRTKKAQDIERQVALFKETKQLDLPPLLWNGESFDFSVDDQSSDPFHEWQESMLNSEMIQSTSSYSESDSIYGAPSVEVIEKTETSITTKTTYSDDLSIYHTRTIRTKPQMKLIQSSEPTNLSDILVPIVSEKELVNQKLTGSNIVNQNLVMGYNYSTGWVEDYFSIPLVFIRLTFSFSYEFHFWLIFPLDISIEHPAGVAPGINYELKVTLTPQDESDYLNSVREEFSIGYGFDMGFKIETASVDWNKVWYKSWYWCIWCRWGGSWEYFWSYYWWPTSSWDTLVDLTLSDIDYFDLMSPSIGAHFETPMNNAISLIKIESLFSRLGVNLVSLFGFLPTYMTDLFPITEIGLNPYNAMIADEKITASLGVYPSDTSEIAFASTVQWGSDSTTDFYSVLNSILDGFYAWDPLESLEEAINPYAFGDGPNFKTLSFSIPENTNSSSVRFEVDDLNFYPAEFFIRPSLEISWGSYLGGGTSDIRIPDLFAPISDPIQLALAGTIHYSSNYYYSSNSLIDDGNYDFDFNVTPLPIIDPFQQSYLIDLRSFGDQEDFIDLEVSGIPINSEYTVSFDQNPASYPIRPDINTNSGNVIINGNNTAIVTINIPETQFSYQPGPINFTLTATSQGKQYFSLASPTIQKEFTFIVPEIDTLSFNPDQSPETLIQLQSGDNFNLGYSVTNYGNIDNIYIIQAKLYSTDNLIFNRNNSHTLNRWSYIDLGSGFRGEFSFDYSPTDVYPLAGNYSLDLIAYSINGTKFQKKTSYIIEFLPDYNFTTSLTPNNITMFADYKLSFPLSITNVGNAIASYQISADGWTSYLNFTTRVENLSVGATFETIVTLNVPDPSIVPVQIHNFRIIIKSESNSQIYSIEESNVDFLDPDFTPPGLASYHWYNEEIVIYPLSNLSLGPSWKPVDDNPNNYLVYVNDTLFMSGNWNNGDRIEVIMKDVSGYAEGLFNVTTIINDTSGNKVVDLVWIQIVAEDQTDPVFGTIEPTGFQKLTVNSLGNVTFDRPVNWAYPIHLNWEVFEDHVLNITYFLNDTLIPVENYLILRNLASNQLDITQTLLPGALTEGTWNFTMVIRDMNGHNVSKTLFLDILSPDNSQPTMVTSPQSSLTQGNDETIIFEALDTYPHHWELWIGGQMHKNGSWENNIPVNIPIDDLPLILGINTLDLHIFDLSANDLLYSWTLTLSDVDGPIILYQPADLVAFEHNLSQNGNPYWIVDDINPGKYTISLNGTILEKGVWSNFNNTILIPINSHKAGSYEYVASFNDTSGNIVTSTPFILTIRDVIAPRIIPIANIVYEPNLVANWFEFHIDETNPNSYKVYRNDILVDEGNMLPYYQIVIVDLGLLSTGAYTYKIVMTDDFGNVGQGSVEIVALDYTPPIIGGPAFVLISENSIGNSLTWTINENNPQSYVLYQNGSLVDSGTLSATSALINLSYSLDDLELGYYEFVLTVEDKSGFTHSLISYVQVSDISAPQIERVGDFSFQEGDPNAKIVWVVSDNHPALFEILVDGTSLQTGSWTGNNIELPLVGWAVGTYTVILIVTDESGNIAEDQITIIVEEMIEITSSDSAGEQTPFSSPFLVIIALITFVVIVRVINRNRKQI